MLQGNKTYIISIIGMVLTALGIQAGNMNVLNGLLTAVALLIVMALRSAMKTESGKIAVMLAEQLANKVGQDLNQPVNQIAPQIPQDKIEKAIEAFRTALLS